MGNIGGVRKRGLTLAKVAAAMREVVDEKFPGAFVVIGPEDGSQSIGLKLAERHEGDDEFILVWWDEGEIYPGLIGGKHPRMGDFGYWILAVIEYGIAGKLKTRVFDEGIGYYRDSEVKAGADNSFEEYIKKGKGMMPYAMVRAVYREIIPKSLLPWFEKEDAAQGAAQADDV